MDRCPTFQHLLNRCNNVSLLFVLFEQQNFLRFSSTLIVLLRCIFFFLAVLYQPILTTSIFNVRPKNRLFGELDVLLIVICKHVVLANGSLKMYIILMFTWCTLVSNVRMFRVSNDV